MVLVNIYENYIDAEPMQNRTEYDIIRSHQLWLKWIKDTVLFSLKTYIFYNESLDEFKRVIKK